MAFMRRSSNGSALFSRIVPSGFGVHDAFSLPFSTASGPSQGSVIGPLLFLLFVNDLPDLLQGNVLLFVDDVKIIYPRSQYKNRELSLHSAWD